MSNRSQKWFLTCALLLWGAPAVAWAYVTCVTVVTVRPNGPSSQCRVCSFYSNTTGEYQGEMSDCPDDVENPHGGPV